MGNFSPVQLGPFSGGMRNSSGQGENVSDAELFDCVNLEVDFDSTLANRPAINELTVTGGPSMTGVRLLGKYLPNDGRIFLVVAVGGTVRLITASSGAMDAVTTTVGCMAVIQYNNKLWVIPSPGSATSGGYFDATAATVTWTTVAAIPQGECAVLYKDRIFVGCGISATTNTARVRFCAVGDPTAWSGSDNFDVSPGDGEKLVDMLRVNDDIIIFKEHSTWRFSYAKLPSQAQLTSVDTNIGVPAINCCVLWQSSTIYVLHDNSVYELFNNVYQRISTPIAMTQILDASLYSADVYGLTVFRDRLFIRYYSNMYVYALRTQRWSRWVTARKFSKIVTIKTASIGLDTAYMHTATSDLAGKIFFFRDDRVTGVGTVETFTCSITTKIYDFDMPQGFKAMAHGGITIATSGNVTTTLKIPNSTQNNTWDYEAANFVWDDPGTWDDNDFSIYTTVVAPALGAYARKWLRSIKNKIRFRQLYFEVSTDAVANTIGADSSVRIYNMIIYMREAQLTPKETN